MLGSIVESKPAGSASDANDGEEMLQHNNDDELDIKEEVVNTNKFNLNNLNLKRNRKKEKKQT